MNAPYLLLGMVCGLVIGYAFGWQERRNKSKLRTRGFPIKRIAGWSDARYIEELESVVRMLRADRYKLNQVARVIADCDGPLPCTTCPEKRRCAAVGCIRKAEPCAPPTGIDTAQSGEQP